MCAHTTKKYAWYICLYNVVRGIKPGRISFSQSHFACVCVCCVTAERCATHTHTRQCTIPHAIYVIAQQIYPCVPSGCVCGRQPVLLMLITSATIRVPPSHTSHTHMAPLVSGTLVVVVVGRVSRAIPHTRCNVNATSRVPEMRNLCLKREMMMCVWCACNRL